MKTLLNLAILSAALVLVIYNFQQFRHAKDLIGFMNAVQQNIAQRSELRSDLVLVVRQQLLSVNEPDINPALNKLEEIARLSRKNEQKNTNEKSNVYEQIENELKGFDKLNSNPKMEFESWLQRATGVVDAEQERKNSESSRASSNLVNLLIDVLIIDILALIVLLSFIFSIYYHRQRKTLSESYELNKSLESKTQQLQTSQKLMISVLEDIKEEKERALTLAMDNQQLAAVVHQSDSAILRLSPSARVLQFNNAALTLFDDRITDQNEVHFLSLIPNSQKTLINKTLDELLATKESQRIEFSMPFENETQSKFEMTMTPLYDTWGEYHGISVIISDISYRYRDQELLKVIIEQAPNALILSDADGKIRSVNAQAKSLFAYEKDELIGQSIEKLVPLEFRSAHPTLRKDYFLNKKTMSAGREFSACNSRGENIPVEISLNAVDTAQGKFVVVSITDITTRKKSQEMLESINERLKSKNRELEQFIYTVSHDLKTPLVTIAGFSKRLMDELEDKLDEKQKHRFERIGINVENMGRLLADLLELSKLVKLDLETQIVDVSALTRRICSSIEGSIDAAGANVEISNLMTSVDANEVMLSQCLQNLLSNAISYRDNDRPLMIKVYMTEDEDSKTIHVEDNGVGIESRYHKKIFNIFERLDIGEGTGVGLAIVNTVMEKHGGEVSISSTFGSGSRFSLRFPHRENGEASG